MFLVCEYFDILFYVMHCKSKMCIKREQDRAEPMEDNRDRQVNKMREVEATQKELQKGKETDK